jgi:hypothetical protein
MKVNYFSTRSIILDVLDVIYYSLVLSLLGMHVYLSHPFNLYNINYSLCPSV